MAKRKRTGATEAKERGSQAGRNKSPRNDSNHKRMVEMLKALRARSRLSQTELADALAKNRSFVAKCETGHRSVDLFEFVQWCQACRVKNEEVDENEIIARIEEVLQFPRDDFLFPPLLEENTRTFSLPDVIETTLDVEDSEEG